MPTKKEIICVSIALLFFLSTTQAREKYTLNGYVRDKANGESLIGVTIFIKEINNGTVTNVYGFYSITLPAGAYRIIYSYIGYESSEQSITLDKNIELNIDLNEEGQQLEEVVVTAEREDANVTNLEISTNKLQINTIKKLPPLLGEVDIIKGIQLLPGVTTVGEGATGFNVRGGTIAQNLVLLDEAPVYNSSHLFGFFSIFNPDAVKDVKLIKGGIPAQYGGRLSSILDVRMKEGNSKHFSVNGGIGNIFARALVEAPIVIDKASFVVAGRRSYIDILSKPFLQDDLKNSVFNFYDLTAKVNWRINDKHRIYLSGYLGRDRFLVENVFGSNWGNATATFRWNALINERLFANTTIYYSNYDYKLNFGQGDDTFDWSSRIITYSIKPEFNYYINLNNSLSFGGQVIYYNFTPGNAVGRSVGEVSDFTLPAKFGVEHSWYVANEQTVSDRLSLQYGLRYSAFLYLGAGTTYAFGDPVIPNTPRPVIPSATQTFGSGEVIHTYHNFEPRLSAKYQLTPSSSVKLGYNRMVQYIHLISNTAASSPLDIWTPSTNNIEPLIADQLALGYFKNFKNNTFETSAEVYYKNIPYQIDYIGGADLLLNEFIEGEILEGKGRAYGLELYVKKNKGKFNGWVSYTLSRSEQLISGLNNNEWYPTRFDQTHNLKIVTFYDVNKRWSFSANFTLLSGTPNTFPTHQLEFQGYPVPHNSGNTRNNIRIPPYHRLDVSVTLHGKEKPNRKYKKYWVFSVYNLYNHRNPFSVYFQPDSNRTPNGQPVQTEAIQLSILGTILPAISYNFKF